MNSNGFVYFLTESHGSSPHSSICVLISHKCACSVWDTSVFVVVVVVVVDVVVDVVAVAVVDDVISKRGDDSSTGMVKLCNLGNS